MFATSRGAASSIRPASSSADTASPEVRRCSGSWSISALVAAFTVRGALAMIDSPPGRWAAAAHAARLVCAHVAVVCAAQF